MHRESLPMLLTVCLLAACSKPTQFPATAPAPIAPPAAASAALPSAWIGRWTGPEGTYLDVLQEGQKTKVAIRNLDGVRTFDAVISDRGLNFERDGNRETIKAGSGRDTGMKWLREKSNCLVIKAGEGYCRE